MAKVDRRAMYEVVVLKVDEVSHVLSHESLDSLSNDDLDAMALQLQVAAQYISSFTIDRVN